MCSAKDWPLFWLEEYKMGEKMKYRINKRTGDKISEIGFGSAYIYEAGMEDAVKVLRRAYENGINYYDLAAGDGSSFPMYGEAFKDVRNNIFYQIHFGADYSRGTYGWTLNLDTVKRSIDKQLNESIEIKIEIIVIKLANKFGILWEIICLKVSVSLV